MRTLRSKVDAVMVGAGTVRAERLSLGLDEEASSVESAQPLAVILSSSGDVPLDNLVIHEGQQVLIVRPKGASGGSAAGAVRTLTAPVDPEGNVDLRETLGLLAREHRVGSLLVEGGPILGHAFLSGGLADELFLTIAPKVVGGASEESSLIFDGPPLEDVGVKLVSVYLVGDELFLRYAVK